MLKWRLFSPPGAIVHWRQVHPLLYVACLTFFGLYRSPCGLVTFPEPLQIKYVAFRWPWPSRGRDWTQNTIFIFVFFTLDNTVWFVLLLSASSQSMHGKHGGKSQIYRVKKVVRYTVCIINKRHGKTRLS